MERLAGAISSEFCKDFERLWRLELEVVCSASSLGLSRSDSDPEDTPDDDEFDDIFLELLTDPRLPFVLLPLPFSPDLLPPSSADEVPGAVDPRLAPPEKALRICVNGAKFPLSSYRHAIKYTPGAARVEKIQRIESIKANEILVGINSHPDAPELCFMPSTFSRRGLVSSILLSSSKSGSRASSVPSDFSLSSSSCEFLLDSVTVADEKIFPYELLREGAGVEGGDTRAERMFKEFIVLSQP